jgi:hypothetical protein
MLSAYFFHFTNVLNDAHMVVGFTDDNLRHLLHCGPANNVAVLSHHSWSVFQLRVPIRFCSMCIWDHC